MVFVGVFAGIGLMLLGVPMAFTLALIAGVATFSPNIGPILGAIRVTPLAVVGAVTLQLLYVEDVLGEEVEILAS